MTSTRAALGEAVAMAAAVLSAAGLAVASELFRIALLVRRHYQDRQVWWASAGIAQPFNLVLRHCQQHKQQQIMWEPDGNNEMAAILA